MIRSIEASEKPSNPNGEQTRRGELMSQMSYTPKVQQCQRQERAQPW